MRLNEVNVCMKLKHKCRVDAVKYQSNESKFRANACKRRETVTVNAGLMLGKYQAK